MIGDNKMKQPAPASSRNRRRHNNERSSNTHARRSAMPDGGSSSDAVPREGATTRHTTHSSRRRNVRLAVVLFFSAVVSPGCSGRPGGVGRRPYYEITRKYQGNAAAVRTAPPHFCGTYPATTAAPQHGQQPTRRRSGGQQAAYFAFAIICYCCFRKII